MHDYLVVGAGLLGLTVAERLASAGSSVLVVERSSHLGGLCYSTTDQATGIEHNPYGTHVLATTDKRVVAYLRRFVPLLPYRHVVYAALAGRLVPMPPGLEAIGACYGQDVDEGTARKLIARDSAPYATEQVESLEDEARRTVGDRLFDCYVRGYVRKHWGVPARELLPSAFGGRFGVHFSTTTTYFRSARWQGLPAPGYGELFERMAASPRIDVMLGCDYLEGRSRLRFRERCVFTGQIDDYFDRAEGPLDRGALDLEWRHVPGPRYQGAAVVLHPGPDTAFLRTHEPQQLPWTSSGARQACLVGFEYPGNTGTPAPGRWRVEFVRQTAANERKMLKYLDLAARERRVHFAGRGTHRYDNMARTIDRALRLSEQLRAMQR